MTGIRQRQHLRTGSREGYLPIEELLNSNGCEEPCWADMSTYALEIFYSEFVAISKQPGSQRNEIQFLLNIMFSPLPNSVERI